MRQTPSLPRFCVALLAACCVTLAAAAAAHAGQGKPNVVRTSGQHANGGHSFGFGQKRFEKHQARSGIVKRRAHKRRTFHVSGHTYGYDRGYRHRDDPRPAPSTQPAAGAAAPSYQDRPVTPKWVHVSGTDGALGPSTAAGAYSNGGLRRNCLSVKTQITVDGKPMDAFGEACLSADGTWQLEPAEQGK